MNNGLSQTNSAWYLMFNMGIKLNSLMTTYSITKGLKQQTKNNRTWGLPHDDDES